MPKEPPEDFNGIYPPQWQLPDGFICCEKCHFGCPEEDFEYLHDCRGHKAAGHKIVGWTFRLSLFF